MSTVHEAGAPGETTVSPAAAEAAAPSAAAAGLRALRARLRAWRVWIILALVLCAVVLLRILTGAGSDGAPLSPNNPAPAGAMAAAEILGEQGVDVRSPGSFEETLDQLEENGDQSTLLLFDPDGFLSQEQLAELNGLARRQVLVEPTFFQLSELAPGIRSAGVLPATDAPLSAACDAADAQAAERITAGGYAYRAPAVCFPPPDNSAGSSAGTGSYAADDDAGVVVLGNAAVLANEALADHGNAALALRTLGSTGTLVWYLPTVSDTPAAAVPEDPRALLPGWVDPLLLWLFVVAVLAMLWRGRRLGPLAAEPLPVVVRSAETAEGRARLYQDGRALDRAAATLRAAALTRLSARLRLGPAGSTDTVVRAVAAATGRSVHEVDRLLNRAAFAGDAALVQWSQELQALEEEVTAS